MAKRKTMKGDACPVARAVDVMGDRWSLLIVRDAFDGLRRFGDFQKSLGVAKNILADRLRRLVAEGVLEATAQAAGGAYAEYVLTPKGLALFPVIVGLRQWGEGQLFDADETHSLLVEQRSGKPLMKMEVRGHGGRKIDPAKTVVLKLPAA
jgi:DNA-binding HxlR family transcriptional regulator